jgi:hypothetical protein
MGPLGPLIEMLGACVSLNVSTTLKPTDAVFVPSLAVHVTGVVPTLNVDPDAGEQFTGTEPATRSVAVGAV